MNRDYITYTLLALAIAFTLSVTVFQPISPERKYEIIEQQRVQECEIKYGGTVYEKGCNEHYYSINEDRD